MPAEVNGASADFAARRPFPVQRRESTTRRESSGRLDAASVDRCVQEINAAWRKTVADILEAGRKLRRIKASVSHGEFENLFHELPSGQRRMPFSIRTAQKLMKIAAHPILSKATHAAHLPACFETLNLLSALPEDRLEQWIASGTINSKTERADVLLLERLERQSTGGAPNVIALALRRAEGDIQVNLRSALETLSNFKAQFTEPAEAVGWLTFDADLLGISRYLAALHAAREQANGEGSADA